MGVTHLSGGRGRYREDELTLGVIAASGGLAPSLSAPVTATYRGGDTKSRTDSSTSTECSWWNEAILNLSEPC